VSGPILLRAEGRPSALARRPPAPAARLRCKTRVTDASFPTTGLKLDLHQVIGCSGLHRLQVHLVLPRASQQYHRNWQPFSEARAAAIPLRCARRAGNPPAPRRAGFGQRFQARLEGLSPNPTRNADPGIFGKQFAGEDIVILIVRDEQHSDWSGMNHRRLFGRGQFHGLEPVLTEGLHDVHQRLELDRFGNEGIGPQIVQAANIRIRLGWS